MSIVAFSLFYNMLPVVIVVCQHVESSHYISHLPTLKKQRSSSCPSHHNPQAIIHHPFPFSIHNYTRHWRPKQSPSDSLVDTRHCTQCFPSRSRSVCWDASVGYKTSQGDWAWLQVPSFYNSGFHNFIHCFKRSIHN